MRVLVCGSRDLNEEWGFIIGNNIACIPNKNTVIVHGSCRGADLIADKEARLLGYKVEPHPANWKKFGRAAGHIRNQEMLDSGIDKVLAFHPDIESSKGTKDMVDRAIKAGIPTEIIND